jgi:transketolase
MKVQAIHVMTHDSIGLGEDGPTHQPVEHLSALRVIPNMQVLRPCDTVEAAECWELALAKKDGPTILALSRQNLPTLRNEAGNENLSARGGYVLAGEAGKQKITLLATGSEVSIAYEAYQKLMAEGIAAVVVSLPCMELFAAQDDTYRNKVLGTAPRIAMEAAARMSWERFLRPTDAFIGMKTFGESAPAPDLYKHFGITAEAIVSAAKSVV